jgi:hypothetical protein
MNIWMVPIEKEQENKKIPVVRTCTAEYSKPALIRLKSGKN